MSYYDQQVDGKGNMILSFTLSYANPIVNLNQPIKS